MNYLFIVLLLLSVYIMGNYSYLLHTFNCKHTQINWDIINPQLEILNGEHYFYPDDTTVLHSLDDLANELNDKKLFGYLTNTYIQILKLICRNTTFTVENTNTKNPKIFYEYEGWDQLYYLEFYIGTERIDCGRFSFNFDEHIHIEEIGSDYDKKMSARWTLCVLLERWFSRSYIYTRDEYISEFIYCRLRPQYMKNLIYDKATNWSVSTLEIERNPSRITENMGLMLMLAGLRHDDLKYDLDGSKEILKKTFKI